MAMVHGVSAWLQSHPVSNCFAARLSELRSVQSDIQTKHSDYASTTDMTRLLMHMRITMMKHVIWLLVMQCTMTDIS